VIGVPGRIAAALLVALAAACSALRTQDEPLRVTLVAFNDFHGYLETPAGNVTLSDPATGSRSVSAGGVEYAATLVKNLVAGNPNHAVVAAGDLIGASPLSSSLFRHEPAIDALGALGLEFSSVGNHEFDRGAAELRRLQNGGCYPRDDCSGREPFAGARFRYLAANVVDAATGKTLFAPYFIKRFDGVPIAFIGAVVRDTPELVGGSTVAELRFRDEAESVNELVPGLKRQGVEAIVLLIHEGGATRTWYTDPACPDFGGQIVEILKRLDPAVRVVVSGHTHRAYICRVGGRLVTQAGSYGRFVTEIDLTLDRRSGEIVAASARLHTVDTTRLARDPALTPIVERARAATARISERRVAALGIALTRDASAAGETALGDVIADALLGAVAPAHKGGAQIAMMNPGGIRADLIPRGGAVTYGDLYNVLPFRNTIVVMELSGEEVRQLLEQQWSATRDEVNIMQVSRGFSYSWDGSKPVGSRIVPGSIRLDGMPLQPGGSYRLAVNNFTADGGDGLTVLKTIAKRIQGPVVLDAVADYLSARSDLREPARGRIGRVDRGRQ
jgi:5'-nucleotidase